MIPVAATTAPDKLILPPVTVEAITVPALTADAPIFAAVTMDAFNVPVVIPVAATIAPDKLKLPPVTVLATTVPAVIAFAATLAAVTLDALIAPVMFALAAVIPVADWIAPDKLILPPVTVLARKVPTVTVPAAIFADVIDDASRVPMVALDDTLNVPVMSKVAVGEVLLIPITLLPLKVICGVIVALLL